MKNLKYGLIVAVFTLSSTVLSSIWFADSAVTPQEAPAVIAYEPNTKPTPDPKDVPPVDEGYGWGD